MEIDHDFFFYGHSLPSADSIRAVVAVSGERMCTLLVNSLCISLHRKSVDRLIDRLKNDLNSVDWAVKLQYKQTNNAAESKQHFTLHENTST